MAQGFTLLDLPRYAVPQPLDLSPLQQAIQFAARQQQAAIENERAAQKLKLDQNQDERAGRMAPIQEASVRANTESTLGANRRAETMLPEEIAARRAATGASNASAGLATAQATAVRGQEGRAAELQPLEVQLKQRQAETAKIGKAKGDEYLYIQDSTQPEGIRTIQPPGQNSGDKTFSEKAAGAQVDRYGKMLEAGELADRSAADVQTLRDLGAKVGDPSLKNTIARTIGPYARSLGIDVANMGPIEAYTAIVSRLAPNMRPPGSGPTSNFEFEQYLKSLPQLAQTVEGRKLISDQFEMFNRHAVARRQIAEKVLNGDIPRRDGERMLQQLPDPLTLWKKATGNDKPAAAAPTLGPGTYNWTPNGLVPATP